VADGPAAVYWREVARCDPGLKRTLYTPAYQTALAGFEASSILEEHLGVAKEWDAASQLLYVDFKTYLADGILTKVDRASMAHGLEVRVPFLDHLFVERVAGLPSSLKVGSSRGKDVLKRALRDAVPRGILERRKRGFTPPLNRWFEGELGDVFHERVLTGTPFVAEFLRPEPIRDLWEEHRSRARSHSGLLWAILVLENWGRAFL